MSGMEEPCARCTLFYTPVSLWSGSYGFLSPMGILIICAKVLVCGVFKVGCFRTLLHGKLNGRFHPRRYFLGVTVLNIVAIYSIAHRGEEMRHDEGVHMTRPSMAAGVIV